MPRIYSEAEARERAILPEESAKIDIFARYERLFSLPPREKRKNSALSR
jgi:hypothetical protein